MGRVVALLRGVGNAEVRSGKGKSKVGGIGGRDGEG